VTEPAEPSAPSLIIAAPASNSGKTVLTLALLRQFRDAGVKVGSFKVGPDYIDPAFHAAASGRRCLNLDPWAMRDATLATLAREVSGGAELVIGEGVMGLFDGAADGTGSTADLAVRLGVPIVLVVDVRGQAASAAAVVHGFSSYRDDVTVAGVVFNRVGSGSHARMLDAACADLDVVVLGHVPRDPRLALPDRHLGLVQAAEQETLDAFLGAAAGLVAEAVDNDALRALARPIEISKAPRAHSLTPLGQRIAVARDVAFSFAYPHILNGWRHEGAEISPFSPLADQAPDDDVDAIYLPGGYPELHAGWLASNADFLNGLRKAAENGTMIYGECGGYIVLGDGLVDAVGTRHAMAGLLPLETSFAERKLHLGYRTMRQREAGPFGNAGARLRGHEFHYATIVSEGPAEPLFECADANGNQRAPAGLRRGRVMGSFLHVIDAA
jgi:cobyrinic acid a,c-diamide synthase